MKHKAVRVDDLMYKGCEPHWKCVNCGVCVPFHCYTKNEFEQKECNAKEVKSANTKINSKRKGKVGELEWSAVCREHGYNCRRTAQYCGNTGDASDVVGLAGIHQEVKRVERLELYSAYEQAARDAQEAGEEAIPILAHRRNRKPWLVVMSANDFFTMYEAWRQKEESK